jgi:hypothetical protein
MADSTPTPEAHMYEPGVTFDGKSITRTIPVLELAEGVKVDYRNGGKFVKDFNIDLERERVTFNVVDADGLGFAAIESPFDGVFTLVVGELRRARIELASDPTLLVDKVNAYMPANYSARRDDEGDILIEGFDNAGWTLDGYVIPRLASGLIFAVEEEVA